MKMAFAALTLVPLLGLGAPAQAAPETLGLVCGLTQLAAQPAEDGLHVTAELDGGPLVIADQDGPHTGRLSCSIQVGAGNSTHDGPDAAVATGPETRAVVAVPPTPVAFTTPPTIWYYLCAAVTVDGETFYFDESADPTVDGGWSADPATAECGPVAPGGADDVKPEWLVDP
jgi:hypothetical protein